MYRQGTGALATMVTSELSGRTHAGGEENVIVSTFATRTVDPGRMIVSWPLAIALPFTSVTPSDTWCRRSPSAKRRSSKCQRLIWRA